MADVIGHYAVHDSGLLRPLLRESSAVFVAVVTDNAKRLEEALDASSDVNRLNLVLYWQAAQPGRGAAAQSHDQPGTNKVQCRARTLVHLAAYHGSLRCLALLLARGADPSLASPEGETAAQFALAGQSAHSATARAMLDDAGGNFALPRSPGLDPVVPAPSLQRTSSSGASAPGATSRAHSVGLDVLLPAAPRGETAPFSKAAPYHTSELTRPEYSTDAFRMYCFKVLRCSKRYAHDWRSCPFAHPTENARRRDPREHSYCAAACPDYKQGLCLRGDTCQYSHGVFESWLHPCRYKTQLCKDDSACRRPVCFFAHALAELRTPASVAADTPTGSGSAEGAGVAGGVATAAALSAPMPAAPSGDPLVPDDFAQDQEVCAAVQQQQAMMAASPAVPRALLESAAGLADAPDIDADVGAGAGSLDAASTAVMQDQQQAHSHAGKRGPPQQPQRGGGGGGGMHQSGPTVPRMSNAYARFHGLNPKDGPLHNLQMLQRTGRLPADGAGPVGGAAPPAPRGSGAGRARSGRRGDGGGAGAGGVMGGAAAGAFHMQPPQLLQHTYAHLQHQHQQHQAQQQHQHQQQQPGAPPQLLAVDPLTQGHLLAAGQMMVPFAPLLPAAPPGVPGMPPPGWLGPPQDAHSLALLFSAMGMGLAPGAVPLGPLPPPSMDLGAPGTLGLGISPSGFPQQHDAYMGPPGPF